MAITSTTITNVQVRFTVTEGNHSYSDALYFAPEEHAALTPEEIEVMQQARFEAWKAIVSAPPREPTDKEQQARVDAMWQDMKRLQDTLAQVPVDALVASATRVGVDPVAFGIGASPAIDAVPDTSPAVGLKG